MRVALDVTPATTGRTGVARYVHELVAHLRDLDVDVVPFAFGRGGHPPPPGTRHVRIPLRALHRAWRLIGHPCVEDVVGDVDLTHCLDLVPTPSRAPLVMTAHDMEAVRRPDLHPRHQVTTQHAQLKAFAKASRVLANSSATADALQRHGVDSKTISVTPLGVSPLPPAGRSPVQPPFLLAVGEVNARKDLPTLITAFRRAQLPRDLRLVLVGAPGYRAEETLSLVAEDVIALGRVDDMTLAALYQQATALCFPSLGEGFGLPLIEAMAARLPIVASDLPVCREVAQSFGTFVAPGSVEGWMSALESLLDGPPAEERLSEATNWASTFTWERTARLTVAVYEQVTACK